MKHGIFFAVLAMVVSGCSLSLDKIAVPLDTKVVQLGVGAQFIPATESYSLLRISPLWWDNDRVVLITAAGLNGARATGGVTVSAVNFAESGWGIEAAAVDVNDDFTGIRVAGVNAGGRHDGLQVGGINYCREDSYALQVGLLNYNGSFWFPVINLATGCDTEADEPLVASEVAAE